MKKNLSAGRLIEGALILALMVSCSGGSSDDKTVSVEEDDPEMVAAIAKARETLPRFWESFDRHEHGETDFGLKVKITDSHGTEHFWAIRIEKKDGRIFGTLDNDPNIVRSVKLGERIEIKEADISDWTYFRGDKMHGNYTLRVLFKSMPPKEVKQFKAILAEPE